MAASIIPFHVITGCDYNSGFYGVNKKVVSDRIQSRKEAYDLLASFGTAHTTSKGVLDYLEKFAMRYVYCDTEKMTRAELRTAKWRAQKKKSTTRLHLDSQSSAPLETGRLSQFHTEASNPPIPSLIPRTWMEIGRCLCLPVHYDLSALPSSISVTLKMSGDEERDMDSECDGEKVDGYSSDSESTNSSSSTSDNDDNDR